MTSADVLKTWIELSFAIGVVVGLMLAAVIVLLVFSYRGLRR